MKKIIVLALLMCLAITIYAKRQNSALSLGINIEKPWPNQTDYLQSVKKRLKLSHKIGFDMCTIYKPFYLGGTDDTLFYAKYPSDEPTWSGSNYEELAQIVKYAHKNKMSVRLAIELNLIVPGGNGMSNRFHEEWRGYIYPSNSSGFFNEFQRQVLLTASFCEANKVEVLSIGQELIGLSLPEFDSQWKEIIDNARKLYHGKIIYCFNGGKYNQKSKTFPDCEFYKTSPLFISLFDELGVTLYPSLSNEKNPSADSLVTAMIPTVNLLEDMHNQSGKRVMISETCCPSVNYGLSSDYVGWAWNIKTLESKEINNSIQENYLKALINNFTNKSWINGVYWHDSYYNANNPENARLMDLGPSPFSYQMEAKPAFKNIKKLLRE